MTDWTSLDRAQADVLTTRKAHDAALLDRAYAASRMRDGGVTIYAIAKRLGVTQSAVRKMLGL